MIRFIPRPYLEVPSFKTIVLLYLMLVKSDILRLNPPNKVTRNEVRHREYSSKTWKKTIRVDH